MSKRIEERVLPHDAIVDSYWSPFGDDGYSEEPGPITLEGGTVCRDMGDAWEVVGGRWDGIRFSKWTGD